MYLENDIARGVDGTFMWFSEEVGELAAALRDGSHEDRMGEFADVLAWLTTMANVVGVDLSEAVTKTGSGCPGCGHLVCNCSLDEKPETPTPANFTGDAPLLHPLAAAVVPTLCVWPAQADAAGSPDGIQIERVDVGFANGYKLGRWTPLRVTLSSPNAQQGLQLEVVTDDGDGVAAGFLVKDQAVRVEAGGEATAMTYVKFGRLRPSLTIRVRQGEAVVVERQFGGDQLPAPLLSTQPLIVELGETIGVDDAVRLGRFDAGEPIQLRRITETAELPTESFGYDGVDYVVAVTSSVGILESMDDQRFAAMVRWLRLGGRMVLCVGRRGEEVFAAGHRLAVFAPGESPQVTPLRMYSGLEDYARAAERLASVGGSALRDTGIPVTTFDRWQGAIESSEVGGPAGRIPTILRTPFGLGQIALLAFDADLAPFDQWQGRPALVARALQLNVDRRTSDDDDARTGGQATNIGYTDLVGQLRGALDQFQGVTRVPFSVVAGLVVLYALLIGPGEYFLLRKLGREQWTWVTFPIITLAFCFLAYTLTVRAWVVRWWSIKRIWWMSIWRAVPFAGYVGLMFTVPGRKPSISS